MALGLSDGLAHAVLTAAVSGREACIAHHDPHVSGAWCRALGVSYHGPGVRAAMPLGQVPQVDRELIEPVVTQVPVGQDAVKEGEAQQTLAL